jgi:uncharacterized protein (TIGR02594 family)
MSTIAEQIDVPEAKINKKVALDLASGGIVSVIRQENGKFTIRTIFFDDTDDDGTSPVTGNESTNTGEIIADAPWFKQALADLERDVREIKGSGDNPRIVEYHHSTDLDKNAAKEDETSWCSSFVNFCMQQAGVERTKSALARSWLKWGQELDKPIKGCVVVFERPEGGPKAGHVGFFVAEDGNNLQILGGNQGDRVCIKPQPKSRKLAYRWPS